MKRIAIPISGEKLSEYFGQCDHYEIFEINIDSIQKKMAEIPTYSDITKLPEWIANQNITDIVAYKVDKQIISLFAHNKINLFVGVKVNTPNAIIEEYMNGTLRSDYSIISEITDL